MDQYTLLQLGCAFPFGAPNAPFTVSLNQAPLVCVYTLDKVQPEDIQDFQNGKVSFSFYKAAEGVLSFMMKIDSFCGWSDAQYAPSIDLFEKKDDIPIMQGRHTPVSLILVDRNSGIIASIRLVTVSYPFMYRLKKELAAINKVNLSPEKYLASAVSVLEKHSTEQLVELSKHVERASITVN